MIDNFAPQPYPLECSTDGETWSLVIGWKVDQLHRVMPVISPGLVAAAEMTTDLQFRLADTRPVAATPTMRPAAPRRETPA